MSQNKLLRNIDTKPDSSRPMDKIHTRSFKGYFRRLRILGGALLFTLYFGTVWLASGDRHQRIRLDLAPMSAGKLLKRIQKHNLWLVISVASVKDPELKLVANSKYVGATR